MSTPFVKFSPTQNVTILVTDIVPRERQPGMAAELLAYDGVGGEQVGFLEPPTIPGAQLRLQMMGGEFCGNATMCLGAYIAWKNDLEDGAYSDLLLEVSGAPEPVPCRIERVGSDYRGTVRMPLPERFGTETLETDRGILEAPAVSLSGITHLIVPVDALSREEIERRIRAWSGKIDAPALGVLRYDEPGQHIEPIVYVPSTDTAVWERGCGSGTAALGCWKALSARRPFCAPVRQPGGAITVFADVMDDQFIDLTITGTVKIVASGEAFLERQGCPQP